jgi:hypothetical protein
LNASTNGPASSAEILFLMVSYIARSNQLPLELP